MKKVRLVFLVALLSRGMQSHAEGALDGDDIVTRLISVESFQRIVNDAVAHIVFSQADEVSVKVYGPEKYIEDIEIFCENGVLKIKDKHKEQRNGKNKRDKDREEVVIHISNPHITGLMIHGVGDFVAEGPVKSDNLALTVTGVGDVSFDDLVCTSIHAVISGVGDITLFGKSQRASYTVSGVGDLDARDFVAHDVYVRSTGVGDVSCYASDGVDVVATGVGTVTLFGNPMAENISVTGRAHFKKRGNR